MKKFYENVGIVVLAAGASARLGTPKQSLEYKGETLLRRAVRAAIASGCHPIVVTLGANADVLRGGIKALKIHIAENKNWQSGMSGSIHCGLEKLTQTNPQTEGAIITVCDQPFASAEIFTRLIEKHQATGAPIVACAYNETVGVPAFFSRQFFPQLFSLEGDSGAKKILRKFSGQVSTVAFPKGAFDIDTAEDYSNLRKTEK